MSYYRATLSGKRFGENNHAEEPKKSRFEQDKDLIIMLYKDSANKSKEIFVLSQLYGKKESEVAAWLEENHIKDKYTERAQKLKE